MVVKPIAVPQPDGDVKLGAGAADLEPHEIREATATTRALSKKTVECLSLGCAVK